MLQPLTMHLKARQKESRLMTLHKTVVGLVSLLLLTACDSPDDNAAAPYPLHKSVTITVFWIGETGDADNGYIPNLQSAWDDRWQEHYGGVDTPDERNGYYPAAFTPRENPFYCALPYNDLDSNGVIRENIEAIIPWADNGQVDTINSYCKNRWVRIVTPEKTAYAQWEDVGPFGEEDAAYVFGTAAPENTINASAGLDLSPAVRDYLGTDDIDTADWQFVEEKDVPAGPWKDIITRSPVCWE
jgi:hypothetical protein